jgi:hypothetical protein
VKAGIAGVLECGDTVSSPYGDGLVLGQRDEDGMTAVKLQWGAVAFLSPDAVSLVLKAVDVSVLHVCQPVVSC